MTTTYTSLQWETTNPHLVITDHNPVRIQLHEYTMTTILYPLHGEKEITHNKNRLDKSNIPSLTSSMGHLLMQRFVINLLHVFFR